MSGTERTPDAVGLIERLGRKALADACGVKRTSVGQWIYNESIPERHFDAIRSLAQRLGVDIAEFGFTSGGGA